MNTYYIWERGIYKSRNIKAFNMYDAVRQFAGVEQILKLSGDPYLSTKNNVVRFIAADGSAREFTAYEIRS